MELQSSLSISCSISLILIGLILHIDQNKEEKTPIPLYSAAPTDSLVKNQDCTYISANQKVVAPQITAFFEDNKEAYLPPSLQLAFTSDTSCLSSDSTLIIKPENKISLTQKDRHQSLDKTFQRVDKILAVNQSRKEGPIALFFEIPVAEHSL